VLRLVTWPSPPIRLSCTWTTHSDPGRSVAEQTILIQLAATGSQDGYYVPTPRAIAGGNLSETVMDNYSATVMTNVIGPEGGQLLVERTLEASANSWRHCPDPCGMENVPGWRDGFRGPS